MARKLFFSFLHRSSVHSTPTNPESPAVTKKSIIRSKTAFLSPLEKRNDVTSFKKLLNRAKDCRATPLQVVDAMLSLNQVLPRDVGRKLAAYFLEVLEEMVAILIEKYDDNNAFVASSGRLGMKRTSATMSRLRMRSPQSSSSDVRVEHGHSWAVMMFMTQGPQSVRYKLARKVYVNKMVNGLKGQVEPVVAEHIANVLLKLLSEDPKKMCELLGRAPQFVDRLVDHVDVMAISELLPRLISRQGFGSRTRYTFTKSNRKGIAMLGNADAQHALADRFANCASHPSLNTRNVAAASNAIDAMIGITVRSMLTKRRETDPEEEDDDKYISHLGIITSATFNASLDQIDLTLSPAPIGRVLGHAFRSENDSFIEEALRLPSEILSIVLEARDAVEPSITELARRINTEGVVAAAMKSIEKLAKLIDVDETQTGRVGRKRLAAVELVSNILKTHPGPEHIEAIERFRILPLLLKIFSVHENSSILHEAVASAVEASFSYSLNEKKPLALSWIKSGMVLPFLLDLWKRCTENDRIRHIYQRRLVEMIKTIRDRLVLDSTLKAKVVNDPNIGKFDELCQGPIREHTKRRPKPLGGRNPSRLDTSVDMAEELASEEDLGKRIYVQHKLQEAMSKTRDNEGSTEVGILAHVKENTKGASPLSAGLSRWRKSSSP